MNKKGDADASPFLFKPTILLNEVANKIMREVDRLNRNSSQSSIEQIG
jgi:hypothetical protein